MPLHLCLLAFRFSLLAFNFSPLAFGLGSFPFRFGRLTRFLRRGQPATSDGVPEPQVLAVLLQMQTQFKAGQSTSDTFDPLVPSGLEPIALQCRTQVVAARIEQEVLGHAHFVPVDLELVLQVFVARSTYW